MIYHMPTMKSYDMIIVTSKEIATLCAHALTKGKWDEQLMSISEKLSSNFSFFSADDIVWKRPITQEREKRFSI